VASWKRYTFSYTHVTRSREFDEQESIDQFSSFNLSIGF
jgi:hypothetical protein